ncbi:tetraacyldisaccharide 4'-kinase [Flectobacillus major]|uniref:tetraacyldisaccharide 4'-kinase n=1 Tax=Flectobacillus major TaxID=103 RepID=UPI001E29D13C|nr:tetraacyldisaccharide 4'-kinase [Flectobacillus major]
MTNQLLTYILWPFSLIYGLVTDIRNFFYDNGYQKSRKFALPIINVGNLTVGGTGKSPHVEYLIRLLSDTLEVTTLSRGYGRKTKGFIRANEQVNASVIGDEPMQFYAKFKNKIQVTVGEKRVEAVEQILQGPKPDVIILDDAYQHRAIQASINIVLMDYHRPIYQDYPFPAGRLRERRVGLKRADIIVVAKCPEGLSQANQNMIVEQLKPYKLAQTPVFFTAIAYSKPILCVGGVDGNIPNDLLLVSGIAKPELFEQYAQTYFQVHEHIAFGDHHAYTSQDIDVLLAKCDKIKANTKGILMTEKDMVKIKPLLMGLGEKQALFYYLPIEIFFLNHQAETFNQIILKHCKP